MGATANATTTCLLGSTVAPFTLSTLCSFQNDASPIYFDVTATGNSGYPAGMIGVVSPAAPAAVVA